MSEMFAAWLKMLFQQTKNPATIYSEGLIPYNVKCWQHKVSAGWKPAVAVWKLCFCHRECRAADDRTVWNSHSWLLFLTWLWACLQSLLTDHLPSTWRPCSRCTPEGLRCCSMRQYWPRRCWLASTAAERVAGRSLICKSRKRFAYGRSHWAACVQFYFQPNSREGRGQSSPAGWGRRKLIIIIIWELLEMISLVAQSLI